MLRLHGLGRGRKSVTWRTRAIRAAIGAAVPCLLLAGRSSAIPEEPSWTDAEYDWGGTDLYFSFTWDGSPYSSTDRMHMYRDIGYLQEFENGTTWASFGDAIIRDDHWQSTGVYDFYLQADDGTDLSWLSGKWELDVS